MKAILIIDMPKDCWDCPCFMDVGWRCQCRMDINEDVHDGRPEWCPLKPLPKREPEHFTSNGEEVHDVYFQGWNDCIDEIMGEKNENR